MDRFKKYQRIVLVILIITAIALLLPVFSKLTVEEILTYTPPYPLLAVAVLLALYSLKAFVCFIPMTALYVTAGIMFPPVWAVIVTYLGISCEIAIGYRLGRYLGGERIMELISKNTKAANAFDYIGKHSSVVIFTACLIPGPLPFDVMSWLFGASNVGFLRCLVYSLLGISAAMIPWVLGGSTIVNPLSKEFLTPFAICLLIALVVLFLLRLIEKKHPPDKHGEGSAMPK